MVLPAAASSDEQLLPELFPIKLIGAFIAVDFVAGCGFGCSFCISRRHPVRDALLDEARVLASGVSAEQVAAWLRTMPSYRAGVQLRLGHDTDAGLQFDESARLIELLEPDRSVVYLSRKPFTARERRFFSTARPNLLLKLTATPRSRELRVTRDPLALVRSARGLDPAQLHWVVGPLTADGAEEAAAILAALPTGSRLTLKPLNACGLPALARVAPLSATSLLGLEELARSLGHTVSEFFCRSGLARVGRAFFDVDQLVGQPDAARRASDLATCDACPSREACHGPLDEPALRRRLHEELRALGLSLTAPPSRTGPRAFSLQVAEPSSRGDEAYLSHAVGQAVRLRLSSREPGASEGGSFCNVDPAVLRRWSRVGFLPVQELSLAAARVLDAIRRRRLDGRP